MIELLREGTIMVTCYRHFTFNSLIMLVSFLVASASFADKPALQLATIYQPGTDISAYWVSEKLDATTTLRLR